MLDISQVKPNVGHSEGASGITSIIKSILSLENKTIAPNIHFKTPNPQIPFQDANLHVPLEPTLWPAGRPQRISVNSFGIGGSNAHAILESASTISPKSQNASLGISDPQLLVISAHTVETLRKRIAQIVDYVKNHPSRIHDLSYTLAARRSHLPHRAFAVVHPTKATIDDTAFTIFNTSSPSITFVFTGQGAQWPGMGLRLLSSFPIFKEDIKIMDEALQQLPDGPNWLLYGKIEGPTPRVTRTL